MELGLLVNEILLNAQRNNTPNPYRNVYFIKVLNPGDRIMLFVSFRWKSSKNEVFICTTEINLEHPTHNVTLNIALLKPKERESTTFFRKKSHILYKSIGDILHSHVIPIITEKLNKVENYYVKD